MPVTERVMALGNWSVNLQPETPYAIRAAISTPFSTIVITPTRLQVGNLTDGAILAVATYSGAVTRPGPQFELGGYGLSWFLGDEDGGAGVSEAGFTFLSSDSVHSALASKILTGTSFTTGSNIGAMMTAWTTGIYITRRTVLDVIAHAHNCEWRISPSRFVQINTPTALYGTTPTAVIVKNRGPQEAGTPYGVTGRVGSAWDWEQYGSKAAVFSQLGYGTSGGVSPYRDPAGNLMTVIRGFEQHDAYRGSETNIAAWWVDQINRGVRSVTVTAEDFNVTGKAPCGGYVYLHDVDLGLYDLANQVQYGGGIIHPVVARINAVTWPIEKGMGVYIRQHDGTSVTYTDLSEYVVPESPGASFEIATSAQRFAPPTQAPPLHAFFSPWQHYNAEWRATSVNPVIGNGTIAVSYRRLGTRLEINGKITPGSTTTFGNGEYRVTLPPGCVSTATLGQQLGNLLLIPSGGGAAVPASLWVDQSATEMRMIYWPTSTTTGSVTQAAPFTFANGSYMTFDMVLEIQP